MSDDTKTFRTPNLTADSVEKDPFISVRSERTVVGISVKAREMIGAEQDKHLRLALDRTGTPWVGVVEEPTGQGEPAITTDGGTLIVHSSLFAMHLTQAARVDTGEGFRFYFTGETAPDPETDATLYQLTTR